MPEETRAAIDRMMTDRIASQPPQKPVKAISDSPYIGVAKLDRDQFGALVLWLRGMKIREIASTLRMLESSVNHVTRERKNGGYMPKARKDMTRSERQKLLDHMKENRIDGGIFPDLFFTVKLGAVSTRILNKNAGNL